MAIRSIDDIASVLASASEVVVCGHTNPDGDCLGSALGLVLALRERGISATPLLADEGGKVELYNFLPSAREFRTSSEYLAEHQTWPEVFMSVDVPDEERLADARELFRNAQHTIGLDHHPDTVDYADAVFSDPSSAATGMLIWDIIAALGVQPTPAIAQCCYVATMTDTGRFQYQNTDQRVFVAAGEMVGAGARPDLAARDVYQNRSMASLRLEELTIAHMTLVNEGTIACSWVTVEDMDRLGATKDDADGLSDALRSLKGVKVAVMLRLHGDGSIRGSLRAKGDQDVSVVARKLGGGGHRAAAGFTYEGSLDSLLPLLLDLLSEV